MFVQRLHEDAKLPTKGSIDAAGYDLYSLQTDVVPAGGRVLISTGLAIRVPVGTYGRIAPRSGLAVKHGIDVGAGVCDFDYSGEVRVLLFNHGSASYTVEKGDRIAQMVLEKIEHQAVVIEVSELPDTVRGCNGFGSTGL